MVIIKEKENKYGKVIENIKKKKLKLQKYKYFK